LVVEDADVMATVLADASLYEFTGGEPPTRDVLARRYSAQTRGRSADGCQRWINSVVVLGPERRPIGYVQATVPVNGDPAEVAWVIGRPWQGHGYAGQAARLLLDDLAEQGIDTVVVHIHPGHGSSQRVATRLGMTSTGVVVHGEVRWAGTIAHG
jgi:RimJ/RimL family protein N-acetyltransferase